jgi:ribonucleotide monophosphatase NagD (HAD superfamily)
MNIAVDFDGVIHRYSKGWHDGTIYDGPMPGCCDALHQLQDRGHKITIYSSRTFTRPSQLNTMKTWLLKYKIPYDSIATEGKPPAHVYLDDRGLRFTEWEKAFWELLDLADEETTKQL